jgi:hypothetical protein
METRDLDEMLQSDLPYLRKLALSFMHVSCGLSDEFG